MKTIIKQAVLLGVLLLCFSCSKESIEQTGNITNEQSSAFWSLTGNVYAHDPGIIKESTGTWWVFTTGTGIPIKYSADGKTWTQGTQIGRAHV